ncbi:MAG: hypothetical protein K2X91_15970, partial [Thermoleophilia bacterium]|nr:hypothetical protein [Thermoleophilia bacterium]
APAPLPDLSAAPRAQPGPPPTSVAPGGSVAWSRQPIFTANFQVTYVDANRALAEEVARAAEAAREAGLKRWGDASGGLPWAPRCEIVIFPTAKEFSRETGQAPDSPGFSTMGVNNGKVVFRRLTLRADHAGTVRAVLPHEVTHVILADLFPSKPIPRWADEGLAVLAEPAAEQQARAADLDAPLATGRLFRLGDLMAMDYPESRHWPLYYAQSVSLTRFLVEAKGPSTFLAFVKASQDAGVEPALKRTYGIGGYDDLHARWLSYARSRPRAPSALADAAESRDAALEKATRE